MSVRSCEDGVAGANPTRNPSDAKYTEREMVLAKRAAYVLGAGYEYGYAIAGRLPTRELASAERELRRERLAADRYPLPSVTRPRVVRDTYSCEWRAVDGALEWRTVGHISWTPPEPSGRVDGMYLYPDRVQLLADLLANPTETVEGE